MSVRSIHAIKLPIPVTASLYEQRLCSNGSKRLRIVYRVAIRNQLAGVDVVHASVHTRRANPARLMQAWSRRLQETLCTSHEQVTTDTESPNNVPISRSKPKTCLLVQAAVKNAAGEPPRRRWNEEGAASDGAVSAVPRALSRTNLQS